MSDVLFLEDAVGERSDRLDYWYFPEEMPVVNAPTDSADTQFTFPKGSVLLIRKYIQNVYGIWGTYNVDLINKSVSRYILLHNDSGYLAVHKVIPI